MATLGGGSVTGGRRFLGTFGPGSMGGLPDMSRQLGMLTSANLGNAIDATQLQKLFFKEGMTALDVLKRTVSSGGGGFNRQAKILELLRGIAEGSSQMQLGSLGVGKEAQGIQSNLLKEAGLVAALRGFAGAFN